MSEPIISPLAVYLKNNGEEKMTKLERLAESFKTHKAKIVHDDDKMLVMEWRNKNGSSAYAVKYIVDKVYGTLFVEGDLGFAVACWYSHVTTEDILNYTNPKHIDYFVGKLKCSTDKYTRDVLNSLFVADGRVVDDRVYLWAIGFEMAYTDAFGGK